MAVSGINIQVAIDQNIVHPMELIRIFIHRVEKYNLFLQGPPIAGGLAHFIGER